MFLPILRSIISLLKFRKPKALIHQITPSIGFTQNCPLYLWRPLCMFYTSQNTQSFDTSDNTFDWLHSKLSIVSLASIMHVLHVTAQLRQRMCPYAQLIFHQMYKVPVVQQVNH